jgi:hypothetical protein
MKIVITHRFDDAHIETVSKHAEMKEIEDNVADILRKSQTGESIEDDLFSILYLAFRCDFGTASGQPDKAEGPRH